MFHMIVQRCLIRHYPHAIYLAKLSDAEIIILNVLERLEKTDSSVSATLKEGEDDKSSADLEITMTGEVKQLIEEKMRLCREAGVTILTTIIAIDSLFCFSVQ
jgi:hypothetical protein